MPQDIGPTLRLARPKTHTGVVSKNGRVKSSDIQRSLEEGEHHIELLEYEWPDLPPMRHLKDAVTRQRVSRGITYILPVDKGKNSIDSKFRTDLRAMFQEPYATEKPGYDDKKVTMSAKLHFQTNTVDTKWTRKLSEQIPVKVSSEAERIRKLYAHSAPAGGRSKVGVTEENLRTRSSLFLPLKAKANPESVKLRKEVQKIIKNVQEDNDEYDAEKDTEGVYDPETKRKMRQSIFQFRLSAQHNSDHMDKVRENYLTAAGFQTYNDLRKAKPPKFVIPDQFKSEYLTPEKNQSVWDWLHYGEGALDLSIKRSCKSTDHETTDTNRDNLSLHEVRETSYETDRVSETDDTYVKSQPTKIKLEHTEVFTQESGHNDTCVISSKRQCKSDIRSPTPSTSSMVKTEPKEIDFSIIEDNMVSEVNVQTASGSDRVTSEDIVRTVDGVTVRLQEEELWNSFRVLQTEMIINRGGRRMFPHIIVAIDGLQSDEIYSVAMEIVDADDRRYKYVNNKWMAMGIADPGAARHVYVHPDSPCPGAIWTKNYVSFAKVRLTNNKESKESILLHSMHKYMVTITIKEEDKNMRSGGRTMRFDFPETTFIAVTAYQNNAITQLKIQNNPFAKAFRDATISSRRSDNAIGKLENKNRSINNAGRIPTEGKFKSAPDLLIEQSLKSSQQPRFDLSVPSGLRYCTPASLYMPWLNSFGLGYPLPAMMPMWYTDRTFCPGMPTLQSLQQKKEPISPKSEENVDDRTVVELQ